MSPVVFRHRGSRFQFYANEGLPREPPHIHIVRAGAEAKVWAHPAVKLAYNDGFGSRELSMLERQVHLHREELENAWHEFFGSAN